MSQIPEGSFLSAPLNAETAFAVQQALQLALRKSHFLMKCPAFREMLNHATKNLEAALADDR